MSPSVLLVLTLSVYCIIHSNGQPPPRHPMFSLSIDNNIPDHVYTMKVNIANKPMNLVIDTASTTSWVAIDLLTQTQIYKPPGYNGVLCSVCNDTIPKYGYNVSKEELLYRNWQNLWPPSNPSPPDLIPSPSPSPSPSINNLNATCSCDIFNAKYAIGNVTGYFVTNTLSIESSTQNNNFSFGLILSDSTAVSAFSSGVFGLGFASNAIGNTIPGLNTLYPPQYSMIFSIYLSRNSQLLLGDPMDKNNKEYRKYFEDRKYKIHPLIFDNSFTINANAVGFYKGMNFTRNNNNKSNINILIDSGSSFLIAPNSVNITDIITKSFNCKVGASNCVYPSTLFAGGVWEINPNLIDITNMPIISIYYGSNKNDRYDLEWCYYIFRELDMDDNIHYIIGISTLFDVNDTWILGDMFLRKYFVTFDKQNKQLGIAPARNTIEVTNPKKFCYENGIKKDCKCKYKRKPH